MDFSKAFDKVGHRRLFLKLDHYGVRGKTKKWIQAFLTNRTQRVVLNGEHSCNAHVISGVPQGSVLGPCLFLLYINDLPESLGSTVRLFADDSLLYMTIRSQADTEILQNDLKKLEHWEKKWLMEFNTDKCHVLRVTHKQNPIIHDYTLHGKVLETVNSAKYLEVTLTSDLRWNRHVENIAYKANQSLGFLRRNLRINSPNLKSLAYKTLVRPLLEYSSAAWDPYTKENVKKLEKVQRRAARYVLNQYNYLSSVNEMLQELQWNTLEERRKKDRLIMFYKIHNDQTGIDTGKYLKPLSRVGRHVNNQAYEVPFAFTDYYKFSYFPRTINEWNVMPDETVNASSLTAFTNYL